MMDFFKTFKKIFRKPGNNRQNGHIRLKEASPGELRLNAIRRKLKDIGYQTDKIEILSGKGKEKNKEISRGHKKT